MQALFAAELTCHLLSSYASHHHPDHAQPSSLKAELRDLTAAHNDLAEAARGARASSDVKVAELVAELRVKAFELQRAHAANEERGASLRAATDRIALLEEKLAALTASTYALESDCAKTAAELHAQLDAAVSQLAQYEWEAGLEGADHGGAGAWLQQQPAGKTKHSQHPDQQCPRPLRGHGLTAMHARCTQLEADKSALQCSLREAEGRLRRAEVDLDLLRQRSAVLDQPQRFVLEQLAQAQSRAEEAESRVKALQGAAATNEASHSELKRDLQRLLRERGALDSLRALVAGALAPKFP